VIGTVGLQDITVLDQPGTVLFDGSFNRGGDIVRLTGDAASWDVAVSGSQAIFYHDETQVVLPLGSTGMAVVFDDGARLLRFYDGTGPSITSDDVGVFTMPLPLGAYIGGQSIEATAVPITAPADGTLIPTGADPEASGTLYLAADGEVIAGGRLDIVGTGAGHETVELTAGSINLDGSFNKGGDMLVLNRDDAAMTGHVFGSRFEIATQVAPQLAVSVPVGTDGLDIVFDGAARTLIYHSDTLQLLLGSQAIPLTGTVALG
jgi:hypothetical protein